MTTPFPFAIQQVDDDLNSQLLQDFTGERTGFVQVGPEKWFFPIKFATEAEHFYNFEVRSDDVWVVTFPRSGTTWTQEMIWLLANNFDYETAANIPLVDRFPFLEFSTFVHDEIKKECLEKNDSQESQALIEALCQPLYNVLKNSPSPRFIKTHLPFSLLPPNLLTIGCKVIYVARNPKDVAVSFYHLNRLIKTQGYQGDFKTYWKYFELNLQPWTPYWSHVQEAWSKRENENLLFLFYEEMNKDLTSVIKKAAKFLKTEASAKQVATLREHLDIKNFRNNKSVNFSVFKDVGMLTEGEEEFIRRGKTRMCNEQFDMDVIKRADAWTDKYVDYFDLYYLKEPSENNQEEKSVEQRFSAEVSAPTPLARQK